MFTDTTPPFRTTYVERRVAVGPEAAAAALDAYLARVGVNAPPGRATVDVAGRELTIVSNEAREARPGEPLRIVHGWLSITRWRRAPVAIELAAWSSTASSIGLRATARHNGLAVARSAAYQLAAGDVIERLARRLTLETVTTTAFVSRPANRARLSTTVEGRPRPA